MATNTNLPTLPVRSQLTDQNGFLSAPWVDWFNQIYVRLGGAAAPSISALQSQTTASVAAINTSLSQITSSTTSTTSNGLNQGPVL